MNINNRLGDYHMSRQDPAVLDRIYAGSNSAPSSPTHALRNTHLYKAPPSFLNHTTHSNRLGAIVAGSYSRNSRPSLPTSLLRQTLSNSGRSSLPASSSIVNMAVHQGSNRPRGYSPVIVRRSRPAGTMGENEGRVGGEREEEPMVAFNPCDRDVVISALKQKRYTCGYV